MHAAALVFFVGVVYHSIHTMPTTNYLTPTTSPRGNRTSPRSPPRAPRKKPRRSRSWSPLPSPRVLDYQIEPKYMAPNFAWVDPVTLENVNPRNAYYLVPNMGPGRTLHHVYDYATIRRIMRNTSVSPMTRRPFTPGNVRRVQQHTVQQLRRRRK